MKRPYYFSIFIAFLLFTTSCSDFVEIDPPRTDLVRNTVFDSDATANAAVVNMYYKMALMESYGSGGANSISFMAALSADEAINSFSFLEELQSFNVNTLVSSNEWIRMVWSDVYATIYEANAIIEGLSASTSVSDDMKNQLMGEAYFMRAFCHFYLVNLFGDVPLVLTSDYALNQVIGRTPTADVYQHMIDDLVNAQSMMNDDYKLTQGEKTRPSRSAATALLARVSLYIQDWEKAEAYATAVISDNTFGLGALNETFLKNSDEALWQLYPINGYAYDWEVSVIYSTLEPSLLSAFEAGDQRNVVWASGGMASKYISSDHSRAEYTTVMRLAELFLIRAEARAMQDNIAGAQEDINLIRTRAGLGDTPASNKEDLLLAIEQERRVELFMEWGHRWMDLKRYQHVDDVMSALRDDWQSTDALYPIPDAQILNDPAMKDAQNPGY